MKALGLSVFIPEWALPWIAVAAVGSFILGANRMGTSLIALLVLDIVVAPLLAPVLAGIPLWALLLLLVVVALLTVHGVITAVFGHEAAGHFTGTWLVRIGDLLLLGPFRLLGGLVRFIVRLWT
jgi:hypothetical protein